jgi:recombinational DNA repair ATPase RecF
MNAEEALRLVEKKLYAATLGPERDKLTITHNDHPALKIPASQQVADVILRQVLMGSV